MDNIALVTLGEMGNFGARKEILTRHIMTIDKVSHEDAMEKVNEIEAKNLENMSLLSVPYQVGITVGLTAAFASIPLCFHLPTAEWFNHYYVTTDVPEPKDLETFLEVGSWTWSWMEPPLGQLSFFLLCLQFTRAQLDNLGLKPYTRRIKEWRGGRLTKAFPQYDARILMAFSTSSSLFKA
jgi:hypothetical protein